MKNSAHKLVLNFERVVDHFGYWPDFHDSEVVNFTFSRKSANGDVGPQITFNIHAFEMTDEISPANSYVLKRHCVITFEFYSVEVIKFNGFNHQNAQYEILFESKRNIDNQEVIEVKLDPAFGLETLFQAKQAIVTNLEVGEPIA